MLAAATDATRTTDLRAHPRRRRPLSCRRAGFAAGALALPLGGRRLCRLQVHFGRIEVTLDQMSAALWLSAKADKQQPAHSSGYDGERHLMVLTIHARLKRTGIEMRMLVDDGSEAAKVDPVLVRLLLRAHAIRARLLEEPSLPLKEIAAEEGISSSYVTRLLRLAFLAPDIITAILNGRHPPQLTANRLMDDTRLPLNWTAQRERLCS
jgi:site-specific DNA recombinase